MNLNDRKTRGGILLGLNFACIAVCILLYIIRGYSGHDITGHWRISAYALKGYDPFPLIGKDALLPEVGMIYANFSSVPWTCVLGSLFYGAFLPLETAKVYNIILHFAMLVPCIWVMAKKWKCQFSGKELSLLSLLLISHFSFMYSLRYGNSGAILCILLMIAILIGKEHPLISGICLGLAMTKPQIAGVVCIVFLLEKQWKPLAVGATLDIAAWIATSVLTGTDPVTLLMGAFSAGSASKTQYLGLLSFLQHLDVDKTFILMTNAVLGLVYSVILWYRLKCRKGEQPGALILFVPACIASTFWFFKNGTDYLILAIPAILLTMLCLKKNLSTRDFWLSFFCIGYLQMSRCAVYLGVAVFEDNRLLVDVFKGIDGLLLAVVGGITCELWVKNKGSGMFSLSE